MNENQRSYNNQPQQDESSHSDQPHDKSSRDDQPPDDNAQDDGAPADEPQATSSRANKLLGAHPMNAQEREELITLVTQAQNGDQEAFGALFERFRSYILRSLIHIAGSPEAAEDLVQDTYSRAWRGILTLKNPVSVKSWLQMVARRLALDYRRRKKLEQERNVELDPEKLDKSDEHANPEEKAITRETLMEALDMLKPHMQQVLIWSVIFGLTFAEIVILLNHAYTENSLKVMLYQALRKIRLSRENAAGKTRKGKRV